MSIRLILTSLLFVWNIVTFSLYAIDKRRAIKGKWRISEKTLLVSTALCGGIGAVIAAHIYHHKTRKLYFQIIWWFSVIIDAIIIYLLLKN